MIVRKRCPYTGVINFFSDYEPHMALGSIAVMGSTRPQDSMAVQGAYGRSAHSSGYAWRSYSDDRGAGAALDFDVAERSLLQRIGHLDRSQPIVAGE